MAKIGIFKKIAALATVIAIVVCFAASAGAVSVTTTTEYLSGNKGDIQVNVTITGAEGKNVSYYAYNNAGPVHIDQIDNCASTQTFTYVTSDANLTSEVKVGYTNADAAENATINARTVTWDKSEGEDAVAYIPTIGTAATVKFPVDATSVTDYSATGASVVSAVITGGYLTVVLDNITGNVTLTFKTEATATVQLVDAAFITCGNGNDTNDADAATVAGDKKLTAIGKVTGNPAEFGIIVSANETVEAEDKYQAIATNGKNASGYYAVQLIDVANDSEEFLAANKYYVGAYAGATNTALTEVSKANN